jgi:flagellar hook protein FlgE
MGFLRSLSAGVTGLRNNTLMMDVIGNNVANINTIGFKGSRITFSDMFSQTLRGASSPTSTNGGTNPMQIGLGASINSLDMMFTQGSIEGTGKATDMAITGNGFFVVNSNGKQLYTRVGTFDRDSVGNLYLPGTGAILQGKLANGSGVIPSGSTLQDMKIDLDRKSPAKATTVAKFAGNLDARASVGEKTNASIDVFDSQGNPITIEMSYTKTADNQWTWSMSSAAPANITTGQSGTMEFNLDGSLKTFAYDGGATNFQMSTGLGTNDLVIDLNVGTLNMQSGITQNKDTTLVQSKDQNGYAAGIVTSWDIDQNGFVNAKFSNNQRMVLGQIMLAEFNNPSGLVKCGDSMYDISGNSGGPVISASGGTSNINVGALETSNVDLPEEFTKMIVAQRGFQSNARVITTSDEILNEVVNLKR